MPIAKDWERIKSIVAEALELDADARSALVEAKCAGDLRVKAEVLALLAASDSTRGLLAPAIDAWLGLGHADEGAELSDLIGRRVAGFTIERLIGSGAAASVFEATQDTPRRRVALKLLRSPLAMHEGAARFAREAAALGRLNHPGIARVYAAGVHREPDRTPVPYIAMEHVDGPPITAWAAARGLSRDDRVHLVIRVARAVHAAHQQAVIHRDLKPANILVGPDGTPKVLDFGIAAVLTPTEDALTWHTIDGSLLGTPGYMSPEQARGESGAAEVRTDVWALGVLLYELLSGRLPIEVAGCSLVEALRRVATQEPTPLHRVTPGIEPDLALITMTAVSRDKERRYPSAEALAQDLERLLRHEPVAARAPSAVYRASRFARRHRAALAATGIAALTLAGLGLVAIAQAARAIDSGRRAEAVNRLVTNLITASDPTYGDRDARLRDVLDAAEPRLALELTGQPLVEADLRGALARMYLTIGEYEKAGQGFERAVELRGRRPGRQNDAILEDTAGLVNALRWQYRYDEAITLGQATLHRLPERVRRSTPAALLMRQAVANARFDRSEHQAAADDFEALIADCERALGPTHDLTLTTKAAFTAALNALGQYERSMGLCREIIAARTAAGERGTPELLTARGNLATALSESGRADEAIELTRLVIDEQRRAIGPTHYNTLTSQSNLAEMLLRTGKTDEAVAIMAATAKAASAEYGTADPRTLHFVAGQCSMLASAGRAAEGVPLGEAALAAAIAAHGPDHESAAEVRSAYAAVLTAAGMHDRAAPMLDAIYRAAVRDLGPAHTQTMIQANNLGYCLIRADRPDDAALILAAAAQTAREHTQPLIESVLRRNLGHALRLLGRHDDARAELTTAYEMSTARGEIANARKAAQQLAELARQLDRPDDATLWDHRAAGEPAPEPEPAP
jgi:tetratricopeptide (TPR) repeat protein/tRNA A-37 threonylcarbamoyl transferase component Bud32